MKVIVFGGSGFLGSHVADVLLAAAHQVRIFDLKPSAYLMPGQDMVVGDILDAGSVEAAIRGMDCAYNFAGIADLDDASTQPIETVRQNILGNVIVLEAVKKHGLKRYVYASTVYVYSHLGGFYRCSKQAAELYIEEYARRYELPYTILRYGSLYGPRANHRNSIYRYLRQALTDQRIVCEGSGDEIREYIHVRDAAKLSIEILSEDFANRHVILTGHHPMKFREMLETIREILGNGVGIDLKPVGDPVHYRITPYSFVPKVGEKLIARSHVDMGQGLLECLEELHREITSSRPVVTAQKPDGSPDSSHS